ncbi:MULTISPECIES: isoprenylcysteine carboxylmethyltransferase family protein [unclassified Ruegeria]|uniref:methyltransferase family protein n=1 Tax=unclassified Ruegeria TaxID=2625375 RepID=UPI0014882B66|nr:MULTISPECIES: isoprenylcysteine carboxylmethyltransferase family protein [unclassified Ruegeria]NOD34757.1 isoprenylcysteine carboxylmethyltransferase family protein [Ruegeria sp. HKCCD7296]NOD48373.1 isoprenylcysteine carboxylmethyltransferase family protein [Ruegeria sp. HKCCD5849]NOD52393.1 isoprenylcysteine carboxylmethyltransferase family protein [Ruegeria sp. HKCCD5851]NOD68496.1 isoprenylcysteine carboxylmethyltransferase family protein [Ruegeria sp. HKCCD7303]NOE34697.1 isoprenylcys
MRWIDVPPVWLAGFVLLAWLQGRYMGLGLSLDGGLTDLISGVLIGGGVLLAVLAVFEFRRHQTTVIPHETPSAMVQSGIYRRSRNPIYLGDVLILTGLILRFDAIFSLVLVPIFVWVLERRFIVPEEDRLRRTFRADFARYERKTRRWV